MKNNIFILNKVNEKIIKKLVNIYFSALNKFNFRNWSFQDFVDLINNGSSIFYYVLNNIIVGFTVVRFNEDFTEIIIIAIDSNYQKKKIGQNILNYIIDYPYFKGFMILDVAITNTNAINFYKKFGFKKIGQRKNYYLISKGDKAGQKIDAIVMQLNLNLATFQQ